MKKTYQKPKIKSIVLCCSTHLMGVSGEPKSLRQSTIDDDVKSDPVFGNIGFTSTGSGVYSHGQDNGNRSREFDWDD